MPYSLSGKCVMQGAKQLKCHPTRARALRHLAALQANVPEAKAEAPDSAPRSQYSDPRARARHAALVRWKKENPQAANVQERLAQIRAARIKKKRGGGGKGKAGGKPKVDKAAQAAANRSAALGKMQNKPNDKALGALDALRKGDSIDPDMGEALAGETGLVQRRKDGTFTLSAAGRKLLSALDKGDAAGAGDAMNAGADATDKAAAREQKKAEREKAKAERAKKREQRSAARKEKKPKEKADKEKPDSSSDPREAERAKREKEHDEDRAQQKKEHAEDRANALADREQRNKEHAEDRAERAKDRAARAAERKKREDERSAAGKEKQRKAVAAEVARITAANARKSMDDLTPIVADMQATISELTDIADGAIKAGRRNSTSDQAQIDQGYELAMQLCDLFEGLGADTGEEEGEAEDASMEGMEEGMKVVGGAIKMTDDDTVYGPAIWLNGAPDMPDLSSKRDYFTKATDFWLNEWERRPMLYHHHMPEDDVLEAMRADGASADEIKAMQEALVYLENNPVIGTWTKATVDPVAVWLKGQLNKAHRYRGAIKQLIDHGLLKISTDSAPHLVRRVKQPNGTHEVKRWPIIAGSLTTTAAEPRLFDVQAVKSLYDAAGIALPFAIDNQEVGETEEGERADGLKAASDRARRLLLRSRMLTLQE